MKISVLAFALLLVPLCPAQKLTPPPDARDRVDRIFSRFHRDNGPGCAVAASLDGATALSAAYGMADLEHDVPLRPDSIFEAGSVSKQFTAAAVLLLAQQGKLSLDDAVRKYIPELPDYGAPLTIRHLLNHTSGLRDWGSVEAIAGWPRTTRAYTHAHVLDILSRQRALNYPPGAEYSYSNSGYNLAAILVERVAGKPFAEFTREAIFTPLGMSSTSWRDDFRRIVKGRAIAYSENGGVMRQLMPFEDVHGNGGLLTTVGDLLKWNQNFTDCHGRRTRARGAATRSRASSPTGAPSPTPPASWCCTTKGATKSATAAPPRRTTRGSAAIPTKGSRWPYSAIPARPTARSWGTRSPTSSWETRRGAPAARSRPPLQARHVPQPARSLGSPGHRRFAQRVHRRPHARPERDGWRHVVREGRALDARPRRPRRARRRIRRATKPKSPCASRWSAPAW